jgi:hypothetical protein
MIEVRPVTCCGDCPALNYSDTGETCNLLPRSHHPKATAWSDVVDLQGPPPDWCPIRCLGGRVMLELTDTAMGSGEP